MKNIKHVFFCTIVVMSIALLIPISSYAVITKKQIELKPNNKYPDPAFYRFKGGPKAQLLITMDGVRVDGYSDRKGLVKMPYPLMNDEVRQSMSDEDFSLIRGLGIHIDVKSSCSGDKFQELKVDETFAVPKGCDIELALFEPTTPGKFGVFTITKIQDDEEEVKTVGSKVISPLNIKTGTIINSKDKENFLSPKYDSISNAFKNAKM